MIKCSINILILAAILEKLYRIQTLTTTLNHHHACNKKNIYMYRPFKVCVFLSVLFLLSCTSRHQPEFSYI